MNIAGFGTINGQSGTFFVDATDTSLITATVNGNTYLHKYTKSCFGRHALI